MADPEADDDVPQPEEGEEGGVDVPKDGEEATAEDAQEAGAEEDEEQPDVDATRKMSASDVPEDDFDPGEPGEFEELVQEIVMEVNVLRRNPTAYAEEMEQLKSCYDTTLIMYPESETVFNTEEGVEALQECIDTLMELEPLPAVVISQAVCRACDMHLEDMQKNNLCSHIGSDGSTPEDRLSKVGDYREQCAENVIVGRMTAKEVIWHMLIDDGSPERGHRANLLNGDFHFLGVAHGRHPSAKTCTVMLFADQFKAKQIHVLDQMRNVAQDLMGQEIADRPGVPKHVTSRKAWDRLMQEVKPDHLAVPGRLLASVHRSDRPHIYRQKILPVPKFTRGELEPKAGVDPVKVRAFVHRVDADHDDCIVEEEVANLVHTTGLDIPFYKITEIFDEILMRRPWHEQNRRSVDWCEIFYAMKVHKKWVPSIDIHIECENSHDRYQLVFQVEELEQWALQLHADLQPRADKALPQPPSTALLERQCERGRVGDSWRKQMNSFLKAVFSAVDKETGTLLRHDSVVSRLFGRPTGGSGSQMVSAVSIGYRRLWAQKMRPNRSLWLLLHKTCGLHPLMPLPVHRAPGVLERKTIQAHMEADMQDQARRNVAKPEAKYSGLPPSLEKMQTHKLTQRVHARGGEDKVAEAAGVTTEGGSLSSSATVKEDRTTRMKREIAEERAEAEAQRKAILEAAGVGDSQVPWSEKRQQTETLINGSVLASVKSGGGDKDRGSSKASKATDGGASVAAVAVTFEARRRFVQVNAKQQRMSKESQALGEQRKAARSMSGSLANKFKPGLPTAGGLGQANHMARSCGSGAFSASAPGGTLGHFHNSLGALGKEGSHSWPQSLPADWDGTHIDHSRSAPQKNVSNFGQPEGYAYMSKEERAKQFTTYFRDKKTGAGASWGTHDVFATKAKKAADELGDTDAYPDWKPTEFRNDQPKRLGKFGRKDFDPQVREKPVRNPNNVSQLEDKPMEEFFRQQERVDDFLTRALPTGQKKQFVQYMPECEKPPRHHDMVSRDCVNCHMDGDQKLPSLGFGQNRHSNHATDYRLFTRPLGNSQLDRQLPLA
eukprot:TRINITY_DN20465_c0_g1_i1.p1 TRINITY_DN20465_c0_g1~~TRINITY_DN20465_c0_g1_i1.p1  ORF type:complete len:1062 (-),score=306.21 TRINITY_DN20465_c0_g1_i1:105-3290(-)